MFEWLADNWEGIMIAFFIVSEIFPFVKSIEANGWIDAISNFFKTLSKGKK